MERFTALLFSGIAGGAITALAALGVLVLYKATGIANFAHGDLITLGAFVDVWLVVDHGWAFVPATLVMVLLLAGVGVALERIAVAPLRGKSIHVVVIATLGLGIAARSLIANWQGTNPRTLPSPFSGRNELFGATISHHRLVIVGVVIAVVGVTAWVFARTRYGREMRALATDREMAALIGTRTSLISMGSFAVSAALAGLTGALLAPLSAAELTIGFGVMLNGFAAMILGGTGSVGGVLVAGLGIGMIERVLGGYVLTDYASAMPFVVMIAVIAWRPEGLLGAREHATRF